MKIWDGFLPTSIYNYVSTILPCKAKKALAANVISK